MDDFSEQGGEEEACAGPKAARKLLRSDLFWVSGSLFLLALGMIGRFGISWALWAAAGATASLVIYSCLPVVKGKKRLEWEMKREDLLVKWSLVVDKLSKSSRERYNRLHLRVSRLGDLHPSLHKGSLLRPGEYLLWLYLKLLMALDLLEEETTTSSEAVIEEQRRGILYELDHADLTALTRQSKEETILILDQRLDAARNRGGRIQEIQSDLTRIEQKLALMYDRATQHNIMGDSGRRINFSDEVQTGASLGSLISSPIQEMDGIVTAQVCA